MIVCHKHKFIFIKTRKTASTSVEIALSKFCAEDDIITRFGPEDEQVRNNLGYANPRNYYLPLRRYAAPQWARLFLKGERARFFNHMGAMWIRKFIDPKIWKTYFKFCVERNPWDKAVSWYYWEHKTEPRPSLTDFIQSGRANKASDFEMYSLNGEIVVDRVARFENLQADLADIAAHLKLPGPLDLPRVHGQFRKDGRHYRDVLTPHDRDKIAKVFAREIAHFGYVF